MKVHGVSVSQQPMQWGNGLVCKFSEGEYDIDLTQVKRIGRIAYHGDHRTFLIAETQEGLLIQVVTTKQDIELQKPLQKLLKKMPHSWVSGRSPFCIKWADNELLPK